MKSPWQHFYGSFVFSALAVVAAYWAAGLPGASTVFFLAVLETSLSFDNAVLNAAILKDWDPVWRRRFMVWGMPFAVFGMRLVFPLLIVGIAASIGPVRVLELAFGAPREYAAILASTHHQIAAFGGAFLLMVFLKFFVDRHKTEHWLRPLEGPLSRLGKLEAIEAALTLILVLLVANMLAPELRGEFIVAGLWGVITYILAKGLAALVGGEGDAHGAVVRQGVAGFLYLELLDASFSFDGVVGAFALTYNLFIIVLGLGAGAMFVRSFTLLLVERRTLDTYRYLEHGAFWAIGALAIIMLLGTRFHIPEALTGLVGAALIGLSIGSSIRSNRRDRAQEALRDTSGDRS